MHIIYQIFHRNSKYIKYNDYENNNYVHIYGGYMNTILNIIDYGARKAGKFMKADALINEIKSGAYDSLLVDIYVDDDVIPYQKGRYVTSIEKYISIYGNDDVEIYSAPGRTEVCGNHTDHQHGEVLAGAINKDAIAVVKKSDEQVVKIVSDGYDMITVNLDEIEYKDSEKESTLSLIKGVLYKTKELGYKMSVIRLQGKDINRITEAADHILSVWRGYTDEEAFIYSETEGVPHNTITPIARMHEDLFELDLVLRNNITTEDSPWGVYHPSADLHHIKKENIGLIEVMGLAVLPARLKKEMAELEEYIINKKDIRGNEVLEKHADWVDEWIDKYEIDESNIHSIVQDEISKVFVKVLECAGVYKRTEEGQKAFDRFARNL